MEEEAESLRIFNSIKAGNVLQIFQLSGVTCPADAYLRMVKQPRSGTFFLNKFAVRACQSLGIKDKDIPKESANMMSVESEEGHLERLKACVAVLGRGTASAWTCCGSTHPLPLCLFAFSLLQPANHVPQHPRKEAHRNLQDSAG